MTMKKNTLLLCITYAFFNIQFNQASSTKPTEKVQKQANVEHEPNKQVIFIIDRDKMLAESAYIKERRSELQKLDQELYEQIAPLMKEIQDKQATLEKKAKTLSQEALEKAQKELAELFQEFQAKSQLGQEQLKRFEMDIFKGFGERLQQATEDYLKLTKNSNTLLIPSDSSIFTHSKYDATQDILSLMDTNFAFEKNKKNDTKAEPTNSKAAPTEKENAKNKTVSGDTAKKNDNKKAITL